MFFDLLFARFVEKAIAHPFTYDEQPSRFQTAHHALEDFAIAGRTIAIVVIGIQQWPTLQPHVARVVAAVNGAKPGSFTLVEFPVD